jgi:hypothetical protein
VSEDEIVKRLQNLLKEKDASWISDEVLKSLASAKDATEIKKMTKILRHGSRINRFIQTLAWAMLIDVACLWLDVWLYLETQKEADLIAKVNEVRANNKRNQAAWQLGIWIWSVVAEWWIIAVCTLVWTSTGWWVWAIIWLAVW